MSEERATLIKARGLRHRWGEGFTLCVEEWTVSQGERVALVGASGAGKSTLLGLISGALEVQEGELWVLGAPLHQMSERARRAWRAQHIGLLAQRFSHLEHLSVAEGCALPVTLGLRSSGSRAWREELSERFGELGLSDLAHKRPSQLSQGERQRFALARALLASPSLILADEPTAHLDPSAARQTLSLLQRPQRGGLIVVTHDHELLEGFDSVWQVSGEGLTRRSVQVAPRSADTRVGAVGSSPPQPLVRRSPWLNLARLGFKACVFYWGRSLALATSLALTASLPLALNEVGGRLERRLLERAQASPLVVGSHGSRFDLTLRSLYFKGAELTPLKWGDLKRAYRVGGVQVAPLHLRFSAQGAPLVGTTLEYLELRRLELMQGRAPQRLGEVALGASVASALELKVGDRLMSDQEDLYNLASTYPVELEVVGIFKRAGTPDDEAILTDVKTCWVIEGKGHGHAPAEGQQGAGLVIAQRLTGEGATPVHFHGDMSAYPISSLLVSPRSERDGSLFKARAQKQARWHVTTPTEVVRELLKVIFKVKGLLSALGASALALSLLLGGLIAWLSFNLRASEWRSLSLLGLSRAQVIGAGALELTWVGLLTALTLLSLLSLALSAEDLIWSLLL